MGWSVLARLGSGRVECYVMNRPNGRSVLRYSFNGNPSSQSVVLMMRSSVCSNGLCQSSCTVSTKWWAPIYFCQRWCKEGPRTVRSAVGDGALLGWHRFSSSTSAISPTPPRRGQPQTARRSGRVPQSQRLPPSCPAHIRSGSGARIPSGHHTAVELPLQPAAHPTQIPLSRQQ